MKLPRRVRTALEATGLPWSLEAGGKHIKIRMNGRFIGIAPLGGGHEHDRATRNTIAQIRRAARKQTHGTYPAQEDGALGAERQRWQSCEEFWSMFNKKQIFKMLGKVIPSFEAIHSNTKLGEVRSIAHRICAGEIDPKISPMEADELVAAQAWVPAWLRFKDEQPQ